MKFELMKTILQSILRYLTELLIWKYKPTVIAITGSVGKTSAKEAVFVVLKGGYYARRSLENYNNEFGVPLTVIGSRAGGRNPFSWLVILLKALLYFVFPLPYPEVLILEMGADRPGDIGYLTSLAKPFISVVTAVGPSHLEFFDRIESIAEEKSKIVSSLHKKGKAVLNYDDPYAQAMAAKHKGSVIYYGFDQDADLKAADVFYSPSGITFKVHFRGNVVPVHLPGALGSPNVYAALAAAGVGIAMGVNLVDIGKALESYVSPPGRLRVLPGVKSTLILDDTYNSAPASALAALEALSRLPAKRKIAVLGDMAELGDLTEDGHRMVGAGVVDQGVNYLVAVGPKSKFIADQARHMGYPEKQIMYFDTTDEAKKPVENLIQPNDAILVKGSRSMRMEKIVREIMLEPHRAGELLVG